MSDYFAEKMALEGPETPVRSKSCEVCAEATAERACAKCHRELCEDCVFECADCKGDFCARDIQVCDGKLRCYQCAARCWPTSFISSDEAPDLDTPIMAKLALGLAVA